MSVTTCLYVPPIPGNVLSATTPELDIVASPDIDAVAVVSPELPSQKVAAARFGRFAVPRVVDPEVTRPFASVTTDAYEVPPTPGLIVFNATTPVFETVMSPLSDA